MENLNYKQVAQNIGALDLSIDGEILNVELSNSELLNVQIYGDFETHDFYRASYYTRYGMIGDWELQEEFYSNSFEECIKFVFHYLSGKMTKYKEVE